MTSPTPTDLVPCPFCGSRDSGLRSQFCTNETTVWWIECNDCEARGSYEYAPNEARETWNTRAATGVERLQSQLTAAPERLRDVFTFLYQEGLLDGLREARGKPQTGKDAAIEQAMGFARAALEDNGAG